MYDNIILKNNKVKLVDSMMGSSKTTEIIKWMDANPTKRYIFVSPLLSEVDEGGRVHENLNHVTLEVPISDEKTKSEHLLKMIKEGVNIACTHQLYLGMNDKHFYELSLKGYTIIIDEEVNVINGFGKYSKDDLLWLIERKEIKVDEHDGMVSWIGERDNLTPNHRYYNMVQYCDAKALYSTRRSETMMVSQLPIKLFEVAKEVIILTYMFEGNVLDCFLRLKGFEVEKFTEIECKEPSKQQIRDLITVIPPNSKVINYSLSSTWWDSATKKQVNDVSNFIRTNCMQLGLKGDDVLWTVPKDRAIQAKGKTKTLVKPKGYITGVKHPSCYLATTVRATNVYHYKKAMFHCYNRFPLQAVSSYLQDYGHAIDPKVYALSEILQWVWRGRIRKGEPMVVGIASKRMHTYFMEWLEEY